MSFVMYTVRSTVGRWPGSGKIRPRAGPGPRLDFERRTDSFRSLLDNAAEPAATHQGLINPNLK